MASDEPKAEDFDVPTTECDVCGGIVPLYDMVNTCVECDTDYSGTGQRLRKGHNTASRLAQERGRDPGVGRPGGGRMYR